MKLLVPILVMLFILALFYWYEAPDIRKCFKDQPEEWKQMQPEWQRLEDVLTAAGKPKPGRSIFFIDTMCRQPTPLLFREAYYGPTIDSSVASLDAVGACAIESAAMHNPGRDIYVLYASPVYMHRFMKWVLVDAVLAYPNVHLRNVDLWTYASGSPVEDWFKSEALFNSSYVMQHVSSLLSFLTLWRYGGTYVSLDSIMMGSIEDLPPNYAGVDWNFNLLGNFLNFEPTGFGHDIAGQCLEEFQRKFDGIRSDSKNHRVLKRVVEKLNETHNFGTAVNDRSKDNNIFHQTYITVEPQWTYFFETKPMECIFKENRALQLKQLQNMTLLLQRFHTNFEILHKEFMRNNCPRVAQLLTEYVAVIRSRSRLYIYEFK